MGVNNYTCVSDIVVYLNKYTSQREMIHVLDGTKDEGGFDGTIKVNGVRCHVAHLVWELSWTVALSCKCRIVVPSSQIVWYFLGISTS